MESRLTGQLAIYNLDSRTENRGSVWFDDGNIVLQAENKEFRVHRSLLMRCSSVFRDMFSLPQPLTDNALDSTADGIPIVTLHDSAQDLECLLSAIYDHPNSGAAPTPDIVPLPLSVVSALLRLGHKYDIPHLRVNALARLHKEYAPPDYDSLKFGGYIYLLSHKGMNFDVVNLCYDQGITSALPLSLYDVINLETTEAMIDGVDRDDGTRASLPPALLRSCLLGKEKLIAMLSEVVFEWLLRRPLHEACLQPAVCRQAFQNLIKHIWTPHPNIGFALAYDWDDITEFVEEYSDPMCHFCAMRGKQSTEEGKKVVWQALPSIFGLGSWDEVKRIERQ